MRVVFIGCVEFSYATLETVASVDEAEIVGVATKKASDFHSDFKSLGPLARDVDVPCHLARDNDQEALEGWLRDCSPDVVYCFGWPYLLKRPVLEVAELGVVGYHPTELPENRGRHPIIWTLVLGLDRTASTFFFMDEGADSGDILSQEPVSVRPEDDARSLYDRLLETARTQIPAFTRQLASGNYTRRPQDDTRANYWRKRSSEDGEIDWRMSASSVHDLVRALARPYPGAHCVRDGQEIKIWKVEPVREGPRIAENLEPGKILGVKGERLLVKCGEGAVRIVEHEFESLPSEGDYLL